jgi:hypothetical protein
MTYLIKLKEGLKMLTRKSILNVFMVTILLGVTAQGKNKWTGNGSDSFWDNPEN